jgi:hypothetical protein
LTDRLAAIAGLAREIGHVYVDEYYAGLWKNNFVHGLLWTVADSENSQRIQPYTAPTWSWASVSGAILYHISCENRIAWNNQCLDLIHLRVLVVKTSFGSGGPMGPVTNGFIQVWGPLREARRSSKGKGCHDSQVPIWFVNGKKKTIYFRPDELDINETDDMVDPDRLPRSIWEVTKLARGFRQHIACFSPTGGVFLLILRTLSYVKAFLTYGLVLVPTGINRGQFRRIGFS